MRDVAKGAFGEETNALAVNQSTVHRVLSTSVHDPIKPGHTPVNAYTAYTPHTDCLRPFPASGQVSTALGRVGSDPAPDLFKVVPEFAGNDIGLHRTGQDSLEMALQFPRTQQAAGHVFVRSHPVGGDPRTLAVPPTEGGSGLTFFAMDLADGDEIAVDINGTPIPEDHLRWQPAADERPAACTIALSGPPFVYGDNHLGLTLAGTARAGGDITVERVECLVRDPGGAA